MHARTTEVAAAVGAAIVGAASMLFVLIAPTVSTMSGTSAVVAADGSLVQAGSTGTVETHSLMEDGAEGAVIVALVILAMMFAWLVVAAFLHGHAGGFRSSLPIWIPAVLLCVFVFLTGFSIGLFFVPSALLALIAAIAATGHARSARTPASA